MKLSIWCFVLCAVVYVGGSCEDKYDANKTVSCSIGSEFEILLDQLGMISAKLQNIEGKLQSVEVKLQSLEVKQHNMTDNLHSMNDNLQNVEDNLRSTKANYQSVENKVQIMNDNLNDKFQSLNDSLHSVNKKLQKSESKLLKIENDAQEHRFNQERNQKEMFAAILHLDRPVAHNLSEVLYRNQENVQTVLQKHDKDVDNVHNITQQIMNASSQLSLTTEIPQNQERVTPTENSVSTTTTPKPNNPTLKPNPNQPAYSSCKEVPSKVSGTYLIRVKNDSEPFKVYCEQEAHGGGWIVFEYRYDGSLDFFRGWNEFRDGFGDLNKEFWLGLEKVHQITSGRKHELMVELKDFNGTYKYARYNAFELGSESDQYDVKAFGKYNGTAGNAMVTRYRGRKFSTKDRNNDKDSRYNCALDREGAWWHWQCAIANLNGRYMNAYDTKSMYWFGFHSPYDYHGMSYTRMMIRELE